MKDGIIICPINIYMGSASAINGSTNIGFAIAPNSHCAGC
jgi:hypothetical protein